MAESVALRPQDALITTSLDGRVLGWSRGAQALFGWKEREILGRPLADLLHEKHQAVDAQNLAEVAGGATVRDTVVKYVRRDQVVLRCLQTMLPLCDMAGRVNGTARLIFDLSALEDAERALRQMVAQVCDLAAEAPAMGGSELLRMVAAERERTRRHYLDIVGGKCGRLRELVGELVDELAAADGSRLGSGVATTR